MFILRSFVNYAPELEALAEHKPPARCLLLFPRVTPPVQLVITAGRIILLTSSE